MILLKIKRNTKKPKKAKNKHKKGSFTNNINLPYKTTQTKMFFNSNIHLKMFIYNYFIYYIINKLKMTGHKKIYFIYKSHILCDQ